MTNTCTECSVKYVAVATEETLDGGSRVFIPCFRCPICGREASLIGCGDLSAWAEKWIMQQGKR